jgi:hypothetical protein
MSKTKDYISEMMDKGIDVLSDDKYDILYAEYLEEQYQKSLREMTDTLRTYTWTPDVEPEKTDKND